MSSVYEYSRSTVQECSRRGVTTGVEECRVRKFRESLRWPMANLIRSRRHSGGAQWRTKLGEVVYSARSGRERRECQESSAEASMEKR